MLEKFTNTKELNSRLGISHFKLRNYNKSIHHLSKSLEIDHGQAIPRFYLANAYFVNKEYEPAIDHYRLAISVGKPLSTSTYFYFLGVAHKVLGNYDDANKAFSNALKLEPESKVPNEVRVKNIEQTMKDYTILQNYFYEKNIYLPEDICEKIQTFLQKCDQILIDQTLAPPPYDEKNKKDIDRRSLQGLNRAFDTVHMQMPDLRDEIKKEFQRILGA